MKLEKVNATLNQSEPHDWFIVEYTYYLKLCRILFTVGMTFNQVERSLADQKDMRVSLSCLFL